METQTSYYLDIYNHLDFNKIIDHPNILIAANFWEEERFRAAKTCYKFMREIDDLIDNYKSEYKVIADSEKELFVSRVNQWINSFKRKSPDVSFEKELFETLETFRIPFWTMETFAKSMIYDIHHSGFSSLEGFLEYSRGASIAPASVFVHLCGINKGQTGYSAPAYDIRRVATPCAIFSYLVHIIRDFQKDQLNNLNYFADDMILKHGLRREELYEIALGGSIKDGFRSMIKEYCQLADQHRVKTYEMIREISPFLEPRYQLSLEIIFNLYLMVYERINVAEGNFTGEELNPTASEIKARVYQTICSFEEVKQRHIVAF
jgi:phytoene/squalene synthetase